MNTLTIEQLHFCVTSMLVGLIWTIQLVHYPSFRYIEESKFVSFHSFHSTSISYLVLPLMLIELAATLFLLIQSDYSIVYVVCMILVILIWASTFMLSVPCHNILLKGKNDEVINKLVITNWPRTILWSAKGVIVSTLLV